MRTALAIFLLLATTALACKVPVFRFALERWGTDRYTLLYRDAENPPELGLQNVDSRHDPDISTKFAALYPDSARERAPFWTGDAPAGLLDSPLRQRLLEKLTAGASTVWILIEGPDPSANDAAEQKLQELLAKAAGTLEIPDGVVRPEQINTGEVDLADIDAKDVLRSPIPLKIEFQTLRLKHGDPRESAFRQMLVGLHPNPAIRTTKEPLLVPIFGRGRMLEALPAALLNQQIITMASQYLCGECSCEVKDENPGADLLLTANWEELLEDSYTIIDQKLPPLSGAGEFTGDQAQAQATPAPGGNPARQASPLPRNLFILALATVAALTLASALVLRPKA